MRHLSSLSVVALVALAPSACADELPTETNPLDASRMNASAPASMVQSATVHWLSDLSDVEGATAQFTRTNSGAAYSFRTTGLEKGHVVTMWWVIFNNPDECENPNPTLEAACGIPDLFNGDVEASVMGGDGNIVGGSGRSTLAGHLREGQLKTFHPAFRGTPGLVDAMRAEVHLVLRSHGPAIPGMIEEMRTTFEAACTPESSAGFGSGPNECADLQAAAFPAP